MKTNYCSAPWAELVAAGDVAHPEGKLECPACHTWQPPIYFTASGECVDCACEVTTEERPPRRHIPRRRAITPARTIVELKPDQIAALPPAQAAVYLGIAAGLSYSTIARQERIKVGSVAAAAQRLFKRLNGGASACIATRGVPMLQVGGTGTGRDVRPVPFLPVGLLCPLPPTTEKDSNGTVARKSCA
jgi:hypothetical protein